MSRPLFQQATHQPLVAPSVLAADFGHMSDAAREVLDAGADLLHLDVMDGHFVPNLTMGPAMCAALRKSCPSAFLDVHLMVMNPALFVDPFIEAGADHLTFHIECVPDPRELAARIRNAGITVGIAMNPHTSPDAVLPFLDAFDLALVMSVQPGFGGQAFMEHTLESTALLSRQTRADQRVQMDGGVNLKTAPKCRDAGCDVLVAGTAIFGAGSYGHAIHQLRGGVSTPAGS